MGRKSMAQRVEEMTAEAKPPVPDRLGGNELQVTGWPAAKLKGYEANAREHSPEQVEQIAASIRAFGFVNPVLVEPDGTIIAGHGRAAAAQLLGLETVPVIVLHHLTPELARQLRLADNRIALNSTWNEALLAAELRAVSDGGGDLRALGFSGAEIASLGGIAAEGQFPDLPTGDKAPFRQITFTVHESQVPVLEEALRLAKAAGPFDGSPNENSNGNALARIAEAYIEAMRPARVTRDA